MKQYRNHRWCGIVGKKPKKYEDNLDFSVAEMRGMSKRLRELEARLASKVKLEGGYREPDQEDT